MLLFSQLMTMLWNGRLVLSWTRSAYRCSISILDILKAESWVLEPALSLCICFFHRFDVNRKSSPVFTWIWSDLQQPKLNLSRVQRKLSHLWRRPQNYGCCVSRVWVASAKTAGKFWERSVLESSWRLSIMRFTWPKKKRCFLNLPWFFLYLQISQSHHT